MLLAGSSYAVLLVDDYIKSSWVDLLKEKEGFYDWFIRIVLKLERQTGHVLAHLRAVEGESLDRNCSYYGIRADLFNEFPLHSIKIKYANRIMPNASHPKGRPHVDK